MPDISIDELLATQASTQLLGTVEATVEPLKVKVTPWLGEGCSRNDSLLIQKSHLRVKLTGKKHLCCGKLLELVELSFSEPFAQVYPDVFAQLASHTDQDCANACSESSAECLKNCGANPGCKTACNKAYKSCIKNC
jgi:hypothetical protein